MQLPQPEHHTILFHDDYRVIDLKEYAVATNEFETASPDDVLAALIRHPSYGDCYLTPHSEDGGDTHGPYARDTLSSEDYCRITSTQARTKLEAFTNHPEYEVPATKVLDEVEDVCRFLDAPGAELFSLEKPERTAEEPLASCLTEFLEIVAIHRQKRRVLLLVMIVD